VREKEIKKERKKAKKKRRERNDKIYSFFFNDLVSEEFSLVTTVYSLNFF
jgi:hypothetical protein